MENIPTLSTSHSVNSHFDIVGRNQLLYYITQAYHVTVSQQLHVHAWCSIHPQRLQNTFILTFHNRPVHQSLDYSTLSI